MSSLYQKALIEYSKTIDTVIDLESLDFIEALQFLPDSIERDVRRTIKTNWFHNTGPPENPNQFEFRYLNFDTLDRLEFLMLINHPSSMIPEFISYEIQNCHIYSKYYEFTIGYQYPILLCHSCFEITCGANKHEYSFDFESLWESNNWKFNSIIKHREISVEHVIDGVIKQESSWCDRCILTPLFQCYDYSTCKSMTHCHDFEEDSDDAIVTNSDIKIKLHDPFND